MRTSLTVNNKTLDAFNELKKAYNIKSGDVFLSDLVHYFNVTHANPYDLNLEHNFTYLKNYLTEYLAKRFDGLQKRNTAVERDGFIPMYNKINFIYEYFINNQFTKNEGEIKVNETKVEQNNFENEVETLNEKLESKIKILKTYEGMLDKQANEIKLLSRFVNQIKNSHTIDKGLMKTTISINMDVDTFTKLLNECI
ncbi:hypothetical protein BWK57_11750 [Flavobacterium columnare]|uniref:hypothetical protein n=1 Tax=Flavobacterium columnare TaxID=996 RepID=UPI000CDA7AFC|nr:hypothetical protein [Flavobacterium columnare]POR20960.1 hypothetical protein BWK57_11750 [Flavobacterium columnare]